jgi:hypothetical protein
MIEEYIGTVASIRSKHLRENMGMEIEEQLRRVIKTDRENFERRVQAINKIHRREVRILKRNIRDLRAIIQKEADERPAKLIAAAIIDKTKVFGKSAGT